MTHSLQVDFLNFLKSKNILLSHEVCNFFLSKQLKFSVKFKPIIRAGLKMNYNMFCEYLRISKQLYEINKKYIFKFYKRNFIDEKKNKEFTQLNFEIINRKQLIFTKYSIDLNILWKPRYQKKKYKNLDVQEWAWLCFQIIKSKREE